MVEASQLHLGSFDPRRQRRRADDGITLCQQASAYAVLARQPGPGAAEVRDQDVAWACGHHRHDALWIAR